MRENGFGQWKFGWRFFGAELKFHREQMGLTQQDLGKLVFCTGSFIGQLENAVRRPLPEMAAKLDEVLKTNGLFARMCKRLENDSPYDDYFAAAAELEKSATMITEYSGQVIPGLFQTESYARELNRVAFPFLTKGEINALVAMRMARSEIYTAPERATRPKLWVTIDEAAIRRIIGSREEMALQLDHLVHLSEESAILLQVVPFSAGAHSLLEGNLKLMAFADAPPVAYQEGPSYGQLIDDPVAVADLEMRYSLLTARAHSFDESLGLVKSVAKGLRT
ncbi:helix-turn-helix domain-containing protein [Kitasatospora viridis]|uniref:helix-turn-helix domain-containing protein n=1 Tax=Kitasatospora viridis TaxID=281105 RepID=UPI001FE626DD|nr:helix-turn-helix transcriptional regulator [Kitasatospora viridis]